MRKNYLLTPGPTPLPPQVMEAMSRPIIHHRTPQFQEILKEVSVNLKWVFQTVNDVFILSASGTGAMECAVLAVELVRLAGEGSQMAVGRGDKNAVRSVWG